MKLLLALLCVPLLAQNKVAPAQTSPAGTPQVYPCAFAWESPGVYKCLPFPAAAAIPVLVLVRTVVQAIPNSANASQWTIPVTPDATALVDIHRNGVVMKIENGTIPRSGTGAADCAISGATITFIPSAQMSLTDDVVVWITTIAAGK